MSEIDILSRQLITQVKEKRDSAALTQLIDLHTGIYVNTVKSYSSYPDFRNKIEAQDLLEDKAYNIYQFALKFDPSRGMQFGSYVGDRTKNLCQNLISRAPGNVEFNEVVAPTNDTPVVETAEKDSSIETILEQVQGSDSELFKRIFKLRYCGRKPKSWRAIGKEINMSHEGCRKVYEKHIGAVKEYLKT